MPDLRRRQGAIRADRGRLKLMLSVVALYVSPGHNFFGHHGAPPGTHPTRAVPEVVCMANRGLLGDRFLDHRTDYGGQITFFSHEVYEELCRDLEIWDKGPGVFRRNVVTRGVDLNRLVGNEFEIQGVRFRGVAECAPCYWMDRAFGPGGEASLKGRGGLRARILSDGTLRASRDRGAGR